MSTTKNLFVGYDIMQWLTIIVVTVSFILIMLMMFNEHQTPECSHSATKTHQWTKWEPAGRTYDGFKTFERTCTECNWTEIKKR